MLNIVIQIIPKTVEFLMWNKDNTQYDMGYEKTDLIN